MRRESEVGVVNVFTEQGGGGNPCPIVLDAMPMTAAQMQALCESLGSMGLYPFVVSDDVPLTLEARQFPKASGYPEDAATGIAATALFGALGHYGIDVPSGEAVNMLQGGAMGKLSRMRVAQEPGPTGTPMYWLSGEVTAA